MAQQSDTPTPVYVPDMVPAKSPMPRVQKFVLIGFVALVIFVVAVGVIQRSNPNRIRILTHNKTASVEVFLLVENGWGTYITPAGNVLVEVRNRNNKLLFSDEGPISSSVYEVSSLNSTSPRPVARIADVDFVTLDSTLSAFDKGDYEVRLYFTPNGSQRLSVDIDWP